MFIGHHDLNKKCLIIAELSANHGNKISIAIETIKAAKRAGADAIKLQTYTPETITMDCDNEYFKIKGGTIWDGKTLYDLYKEAYLPWEWHEKLFKIAKEEGLICFSSPFDKTAVDFLEQYNPPAYKIASFEITDIPLIEYAASKRKPIIISTGIAEKNDIDLAIDTCNKVNNNEIILLKCTSSYPAPMEEANLAAIPSMKRDYGVEIGLSDHTSGFIAPIVAVSLGARIIEKHFIIDKAIGGPDALFSLDEIEFTEMVKAVRIAEQAIGSEHYELSEKVKLSRKFARSLFFVKDIKKGEVITEEIVKSIRPNDGLAPKYLNEILGKRVNSDVQKGTPLSLEYILKDE